MNRTEPSDSKHEEPPNMPGFRTWRGLYLLVLGSLTFFIIFLLLWSRWFS